MKFSKQILNELLDNYSFTTVLDIGCGDGCHAKAFLDAGKEVTTIDCGKSHYFAANALKAKTITADFNNHKFNKQFDCIWCSHVLEHQRNVGFFLDKVFSDLKSGGVLAITVPPLKHDIVGGHLTLWNAGLLLYNLVLAGFDCKQAYIKSYGYNISVIVEKKEIKGGLDLIYDSGDIKKIQPYLPDYIKMKEHGKDLSFNGII